MCLYFLWCPCWYHWGITAQYTSCLMLTMSVITPKGKVYFWSYMCPNIAWFYMMPFSEDSYSTVVFVNFLPHSSKPFIVLIGFSPLFSMHVMVRIIFAPYHIYHWWLHRTTLPLSLNQKPPLLSK